MKTMITACALGAGLVAQVALAQVAYGQENKGASAAKEEGDAAPFKPPMVLQNRYFLKKLRPEVSVHAGQVLNESYSQTWMTGGRVGLFVTEAVGVEYTFSKFLASDSADLKALRKLKYCGANGKPDTTCDAVEPSFVRLESAHSASLTFAPIYGKINLLEGYILYSDIYANVGGGLVDTSQGNKTALVLGIGQRFYFAKSFNVRIDAVDHVFREDRTNASGGDTETKTNTRNAWTVSLGVSAFLMD